MNASTLASILAPIHDDECYDYDCDGTYDDWGIDVHDYPVSGDETTREYGRYGRRMTVNLWRAPNVAPKHATAGIVKGGKVELWGGRIVTVSRIGTVSGFYDDNGTERPLYMHSIKAILPRHEW